MSLTQAQIKERETAKRMLNDAIAGQPPAAIAFWIKDLVAENFTRPEHAALLEDLSNAIGRQGHEIARG